MIPHSQLQADLSELAEQVKTGPEMVVTKNSESCADIIGTRRLAELHELERERIHLLLLEDAEKGLADVATGSVKNARTALEDLKCHRRD